MARRNSRFVNQKIIVGNKSIQAEDLTDSALDTLSGGATGGGSDKVFFENDQVITTDYTITSNKNAMSAGEVTINNGVTVTIPTGSSWTIV